MIINLYSEFPCFLKRVMCKILNMMVFLSTGLDAKYMLMKLMKEYNHIGGYSMYDYSPGCQTSINFNWLKFIDYILIKYVKSTYFSLWYIFSSCRTIYFIWWMRKYMQGEYCFMSIPFTILQYLQNKLRRRML